MADILLVDDDTAIRHAFRAMLEAEGYSVRTARNAKDAMLRLAECRPDLLLLDVMMPAENGFSVCEAVRKDDPLLPIIFLTGLDDDLNVVRGLNLGADDYISKACSTVELLARIRRMLARSAVAGTSGCGKTRIGDVIIDFEAMVAVDGDVCTSLTCAEVAILRRLSRSRGSYVNAEDLAQTLGGDGMADCTSSLRSYVSRLRTKLGDAGDQIVSSRGSGYRLQKER